MSLVAPSLRGAQRRSNPGIAAAPGLLRFARNDGCPLRSGPRAPADGRPVFATEPRILGLPASAWPRILAPIVIGVLALALWEFMVRWNEIPPYVLPGRS
jgi:hypothetical protein